MSYSVLGLLTEILWRDDLQILRDGFEFVKDQVYLKILIDKEKADYNINPSKKSDYYLVIEIKNNEIEWWEIMEDVLLSLQLSKNSTIFLESIHFKTPFEPRWVRPQLDPPNIPFKQALNLEDLLFSKDLLPHIRKLNQDNHGSMKIACDRYSRIETSKFVGDQLIDACIAYEALFFEGEQTGGNRGMAIAVACSMLIGTSLKDRNKIKEIIITGFDLRNKIMHGRNFSTDKMIQTNHSFCEYLRLSLVKLLRQIE